MPFQIRRNKIFGTISPVLKLNKQENTNFFLSKDCHNKWPKDIEKELELRRVWWWKKYTKSSQQSSELPFEQVYNENVGSSSVNSFEVTSSSILPKRPKGKSSSEQQPLEKAVKDSSKSSSLTTSNLLTVEIPNTFRPVIQQFLLFRKMLM
ncbi:hypothetical protein RhiirA5_407409 [Rhizophagus irregularis]|uniref:Uncharacterized protein n=1 Tax=Rhizophagus irregularis TaxID=588596 RepID=A0A2I1E0E1_9GLOM|nr:hypothetical protein RhiirA5_407409 [Rhizophagus irregularis]PKY15590.1 hypothetical protein RhiirB3_427822 [Rhizophagus irregularis]CAB5188508.1 unnamed protein product [Rhizophagus irregularis]